MEIKTFLKCFYFVVEQQISCVFLILLYIFRQFFNPSKNSLSSHKVKTTQNINVNTAQSKQNKSWNICIFYVSSFGFK